MSNLKKTEYKRLLDSADPAIIQDAYQLLTNNAYDTLSPEAKIGFLTGFETVTAVWQKMPREYLGIDF